MDIDAIKQFLSTTAVDLGVKVLAALAFWFIGRWLIGRVIRLMRAAMGRSAVDPTLIKYLGSIVSIALNIALVLGILGPLVGFFHVMAPGALIGMYGGMLFGMRDSMQAASWSQVMAVAAAIGIAMVVGIQLYDRAVRSEVHESGRQETTP